MLLVFLDSIQLYAQLQVGAHLCQRSSNRQLFGWRHPFWESRK